MHIRAVIKIDDTCQYHSTHGRWNPSNHPFMWIQGLFLLQLAIGSGAFGHAREMCTALLMVQTLPKTTRSNSQTSGFFSYPSPSTENGRIRDLGGDGG